MEAVGQLTGGIAHDFNNMLTGVIGALAIMKRRIASNRYEDLNRFIDAAAVSAPRAAGLTARLLAFSRWRWLDNRATDINELVFSLDDLLRRTMSKKVEVSIVPAGLPADMADANHLESAVINLATNARDAMPYGGQLTIETRGANLDETYCATRPGAQPWRYVVVSVSDTGVGMDEETAEKVFAPFETAIRIGPLVYRPNLSLMLGIASLFGLASARSRHGPSKRHPRASGCRVARGLPDVMFSGGKSVVNHVAALDPCRYRCLHGRARLRRS